MTKLSGGNYVKVSELRGGEVIQFISEGGWVESRFKNDDGTPRNQFVIQVLIGGDKKDLTMNKTNRTAMIEAYGDDTASWLGKFAKIEKMKVMVSGKLKDTILLSACDKSGSTIQSQSGSEDQEDFGDGSENAPF